MSEKINEFFRKHEDSNKIENELYTKYSVKKGLRNEDGTGVLIGLTKVSEVLGYLVEDGKKIDVEGVLYYRGISVEDIVTQNNGERYLYEKIIFLILFGYLPDEQEFADFKQIISDGYELPNHYLERNILGFPAQNLMNKLQREILMLYEYDSDPEAGAPEDILEKGIFILTKIPSIIVYTYYTKIHYFDNQSLIIHPINKDYSMAELILSLLRPDGHFSPKEAEVLDSALVLHADHGGGNNSTFTNVVISSTGTDIYSTLSGSVGSLKGPRHGGANIAVKKQMETVINDIGIDASDEEILEVVRKILDKQYNDHAGLVYGIGHAVYTLSDPRSKLLSKKCRELSIEKGRLDEFEFYQRFETIAVKEIEERKGINICSNVDFYSGLIYDMLGIPEDLYTLLFACARFAGWVAHNIENRMYNGRIIRPATKYVGDFIDIKKKDQS